MRAPFVFAGLSLCAIGFGINICNVSVGVKYFGTFLVAIGGHASYATIITWYVRPHTLSAARDAGQLIHTQGSQQHLGSLQACRFRCFICHVG